MNRKSVTSLFTIILSIKSCMTWFESPTFDIKTIRPRTVPSSTMRRQNLRERTMLCHLNDRLVECPNQVDNFSSYKPWVTPQSVHQRTRSYSSLFASKLAPRRPLLGKLNSPQETSPILHHALKAPDPVSLNKKTTNKIKHNEATTFGNYFWNGEREDLLMTSPIPNQSEITTQRNYGLIELSTLKTTCYTCSTKLNLTTEAATTTTTRNLIEDRDLADKTPNPLSVHSGFGHFKQVLNQLENNFYRVTFNKLLSISPKERQENGISFAQSGLFLYLALLALCTETPLATQREIKESLHLITSCTEQIQLLQQIISSLPTSSNFITFRWSSRLVLGPHLTVSEEFRTSTSAALKVHVEKFDNIEDPEKFTKYVNQMVETDSGGAMHDTFEEDELTDGVCAMWLTTMYMRARWRSAPTVLNGTRDFYDGDAPPHSVRMIRINDIMHYAHLQEWNAEGIEIRYADPELTLLLLVPRTRSLKNLANRISSDSLDYVYEKMQTRRIAVTIPIYTLRMTLLLPGKLEMMGISRLMDVKMSEGTGCDSLKLSHAVQRIMFWAEAGRNAFKDDGLEWDEKPELERIVNRPYIYFVRWRNLTLLNGNFVL